MSETDKLKTAIEQRKALQEFNKVFGDSFDDDYILDADDLEYYKTYCQNQGNYYDAEKIEQMQEAFGVLDHSMTIGDYHKRVADILGTTPKPTHNGAKKLSNEQKSFLEMLEYIEDAPEDEEYLTVPEITDSLFEEQSKARKKEQPKKVTQKTISKEQYQERKSILQKMSKEDITSVENKDFIKSIANDGYLTEMFEDISFAKQGSLLKVLRQEVTSNKEASARIHQIMQKTHAKEKAVKQAMTKPEFER